jgi:hypothetical protein
MQELKARQRKAGRELHDFEFTLKRYGGCDERAEGQAGAVEKSIWAAVEAFRVAYEEFLRQSRRKLQEPRGGC